MKFKDIEQLPNCNYRVNIPLEYIKENIERYTEEYNLDMDPIFQRGYVWTVHQQVAYVEWVLRGGKSGLDIYFNHPNWMGSFKGQMQLIDGKQRLKAILDFLNNKIKAYNHYHEEYEDRISSMVSVLFNVYTMQTQQEVIKWYIAMNSGGSIHTPEEIARVKALLDSF